MRRKITVNIRKRISLAIIVSIGLLGVTQSQAVLINNDEPTTTVGHWEVDILLGGESRNAWITAVGSPSTTQIDHTEVVFDYYTYIDVGTPGAAFRLSATSTSGPTLINGGVGTDQVDSAGDFPGAAGNTINWTVSSTIDDSSTTMTNTFVLTAATGTLGNIRLYQYLDEDVLGPANDFFLTRGSAATFDLELFTVDHPEAIGVSHSGALNAGQGLVDSNFAGWAGDQYNNMKPAITSGTQVISPTGFISAALNAVASVHPVVGAGYGPIDVVSVIAWDVDPLATTATIITTLGGVPRAPVPGGAIGMVVDNVTGLVSVFDPATDVVTGSVAIATSGVEGDCSISADLTRGYVTNFGSVIQVIDLTVSPPILAGPPNPIPIGNAGEDTSLTPDGNFLIVSDGAGPNYPLSIIDVAAQVEIGTYSLTGSDHISVEVCGDGTILSTSPAGTVYHGSIDGFGVITTSGANLAGAGDMNAYCAPGLQTGIGIKVSNLITSFSLPSMNLLDSQSLTGGGINIQSAAFSTDGTMIFVRTDLGVEAYGYNPATGAIASLIWATIVDTPTFYFGMEQILSHPDGRKLYVSGGNAPVQILDPATGAFVGTLTDPAISQPTGICLVGGSAPVNNPPVADAGPDQLLECTATPTTVQLDGSASFDPDAGDSIAAYLWTGGIFTPDDMVANPRVNIPLGVHDFDLQVFDTFGLDNSDSVQITVADTVPPVITAPPDISIEHTADPQFIANLGTPTITEACGYTVSNDAPAGNLFNVGTTVVTWTVTADSNGATSTDTQDVVITNTAPVADNQGPSFVEDSMANVITLTASDINNDSPLSFGSITLSSPFYGALSGTPPNLTYTPAADYFGTDDSFTFTATDQHGATSNTATVSITVTPVNDPPIISVSRTTATVQYSDTIGTVTITATDVDDDPLSLSSEYDDNSVGPNAGLPSNLGTTGGCMTVPNVTTSPGTSCSLDLTGQMLEDAGDYDITFTVTDGGGGTITIETASDATEIIVSAEDASITFEPANEVAILVDGDGSDSSFPFDLTIYIEETEPDVATFMAKFGDLTLAVPHIVLTPVGPGGPVSPDGCYLPSVSGTGYDQVMTLTCHFSGVPVNTYSVDASVDGGYYTGSNDDVFTVYDPSLGFTTGGGWFFWPGTADKTNFGYVMKYNKKQTKIQGSLLLIRHVAGSTTGEKYRIKSNALEGLSIGGEADFAWAAFSGKNTYRAPGVDNEGNNEFTVYVEDHGEPGVGVDQFWIQVRDKQDDIRPDISMPEPGFGNTETLEGGNIVVPHSNKGGGRR